MANVGVHQAQWATFKYKFADAGGAIAPIVCDGVGNGNVDGKVPDNALILRAILEPITLPVSGGAATIKLGITGNDDCFIAATAYGAAEFIPEEPVVLNHSSEIPLKTTAAVQVLATVAGATLTAGEFDVHVEFLPGR
jgi:hypothetical protein